MRRSEHAKMASSSVELIGGVYGIDFARPLEGVAPPGAAFTAEAGSHSGFMAVPVLRGAPARARTLAVLAGLAEAHLLSPLAHGPASRPGREAGYFVICPAPPGPSLLATLRPWSETELIEHVVKPAALVLASLQARGVTHRAIRPDNMFQATRGTAVTLGCAWAAPPAMHQPAWIEPADSAACLPAGRGDGTIADDVYALGAVLVMLALGKSPVEGLTDEAVLEQKLENGSYATLLSGHRLPASIAELVRGMLADDPDHRPSPTLLATPAAARARRLAARPIRRAARPIVVGAHAATTSRTLAFALQREPKAGLALLRSGMVDRWLRRGLGDALAAGQVDEAVRLRDMQASAGDPLADPALIAAAIAVLDPAAPLVWRTVALWPSGFGAALDHALHHSPDKVPLLMEVATVGVVEHWALRREAARDHPNSRLDIRDLGSLQNAKRASNTAWRICYGLNPLAPCESPLLQRGWVIRLPDILPVLEAAAATRKPGERVIDWHIAAFIAARRDDRLHGDLGKLAAEMGETDALGEIRLAALMQTRLHPVPLPNLSAWAVEAVQQVVQTFKSKSRRVRLAADLVRLSEAGYLSPMTALLDRDGEQAVDAEEFAAAELQLAALRQTMHAVAGMETRSNEAACRIGYDVAGGVSALACVAGLAYAIFS